MKYYSRSILVAFSTILAASTVLAEDVQVATDDMDLKAESALADSSASPDIASGLKAVRDKKTGKLREPNANERKELAAMEKKAREAKGEPAAATAGPVVTTNASGMSSAKLGPEYMMSLYGERAEDGSIKKSHSENGDNQSTVNEDPTE